jgi:hypothetical protein
MYATTARPGAERFTGQLPVAGAASIGAGAIHATAAGMHSDHRQAMWAFIGLAVFQIGWGALALARSAVAWGLLGAGVNAAALAGWILAKTRGIGFIDGLEESEGVQLADSLAAALAAVAVAAAVLGGPRLFRLAERIGPRLVSAAALATVMLTVSGMVLAGEHSHAAGHDDNGDSAAHAHDDGTAAEGSDQAGLSAASSPRPFDPTQPIDLGGVEGVTPEQQARAENLLAITLIRLPQWSDTAVAEAAGYHSIGDAATGEEHFINLSLLDDDKVLDPDHPEALVYEVDGGGNRTLEAAMFMLAPGTTLDSVPELGGPLTQWHIHDNLCFTDDPVAPQVRSVVAVGEECQPPLVKMERVPMIHVWIVPHPCGPFAALEGVGAGQIREGEERLCDHVHGSS